MTVLVTGGTGFFGAGIVTALQADGHVVTTASRRGGREPWHHVMDMTVPSDVERVMRLVRPDVVVHAAALAHVGRGRLSGQDCSRINVDGTRHTLNAAIATGVRRFVFVSSVLVYGETDLPSTVTELDPLRAADVYAETKVAAEAICNARVRDIGVVILRMAPMYASGWLLNVRRRVLPVPGLPLYLLINPSERRYSLCALQNGVAVVRAAVNGGLEPGVFNVADRHVYSQREVLKAVRDAEGWRPVLRAPRLTAAVLKAAIRSLPAGARRRAQALVSKYCERNVYSTDRLHERLDTLPPHLLGGRV